MSPYFYSFIFFFSNMQNSKEIIITGWFYVGFTSPDLSRLLLNKDEYKLSCKRFLIRDLKIIKDLKRITGSFWNATDVLGIIDISRDGSLIPFFIEKEKAKKVTRVVKC